MRLAVLGKINFLCKINFISLAIVVGFLGFVLGAMYASVTIPHQYNFASLKFQAKVNTPISELVVPLSCEGVDDYPEFIYTGPIEYASSARRVELTAQENIGLWTFQYWEREKAELKEGITSSRVYNRTLVLNGEGYVGAWWAIYA
ncbi:MAG: hypothetical protein ACE5GD_07650 [Candidatus Geothermarchaeales archaeon]